MQGPAAREHIAAAGGPIGDPLALPVAAAGPERGDETASGWNRVRALDRANARKARAHSR
jgi:hypothetical protein